MASYAAHRCTSAGCGLRFPVPRGDPRSETCPACEGITEAVADYPPAIDAGKDSSSAIDCVAVFDSVRSALNVGTMLRAADGAGISSVHLCGLTADVDNPKVIKTALGAETSVAARWWPDVTQCIDHLIDEGVEVWVLERTERSKPSAPSTHVEPSKP